MLGYAANNKVKGGLTSNNDDVAIASENIDDKQVTEVIGKKSSMMAQKETDKPKATDKSKATELNNRMIETSASDATKKNNVILNETKANASVKEQPVIRYVAKSRLKKSTEKTKNKEHNLTLNSKIKEKNAYTETYEKIEYILNTCNNTRNFALNELLFDNTMIYDLISNHTALDVIVMLIIEKIKNNAKGINSEINARKINSVQRTKTNNNENVKAINNKSEKNIMVKTSLDTEVKACDIALVKTVDKKISNKSTISVENKKDNAINQNIVMVSETKNDEKTKVETFKHDVDNCKPGNVETKTDTIQYNTTTYNDAIRETNTYPNNAIELEKLTKLNTSINKKLNEKGAKIKAELRKLKMEATNDTTDNCAEDENYEDEDTMTEKFMKSGEKMMVVDIQNTTHTKSKKRVVFTTVTLTKYDY
ncbi:hypothetical protein BDAP_002553 [Binucleata daphniae]